MALCCILGTLDARSRPNGFEKLHVRQPLRNSLRHVGLSTLRRRRLPSTNSPFVSCQSSKSFRYVAHEGNSWQLRLPKTGVGILVDPWLVGKLTFADQDWLFKGSKISEMPSLKQVELETDLLLITQGLDDHAHRPTLKQLSKTTPVVASPSAATVCRELGFQDVTELRAGDRCTACDDRVSIWATEGALVGGPRGLRERLALSSVRGCLAEYLSTTSRTAISLPRASAASARSTSSSRQSPPSSSQASPSSKGATTSWSCSASSGPLCSSRCSTGALLPRGPSPGASRPGARSGSCQVCSRPMGSETSGLRLPSRSSPST
uniref:Zn-dependent hydrolase of the beta-lactamase fold protein n=1 Tax=Tetraselmis sp. GSL018 TaxID=582737 RepID=A0A061RKQ8_9CHLO